MLIESRVGSKGELFIPKKIRDMLGLKPHMKVIYRVEGDRLMIEIIPSIEEVLKESSEVEISLDEFHRYRKRLSKEAET